jgi:hypothetical protein
VIGALLVEHAIEVELHGVGGELGAVMKLDAVAQGEGVDLPALGEGRLDLQGASS